jgi:ribonuclease Z
MPFEVTILGNNSAVAAFGRHPTAQVLNVNHQLYLLDCGEGTQFQINKYRVKPSKIRYIFISHLHGDHFFGLVGLLTSMSLMHREQPLTIFGPPLLEQILDLQLNIGGRSLTFPLHFVALEMNREYLLLDNDDLEVHTICMQHSIPCMGFLFREKERARNIKPEAIDTYQLSIEEIKLVKQGGAIQRQGSTIPIDKLAEPPYKRRSYAFCGDTAFSETVAERVQQVDLLYHEATFESASASRADKTRHSTGLQAGEIAKKAGVGQLLIGHFSSRYEDLNPLLKETQSVFPRTALALEGETFAVLRKHLAAL